MTEEKEREKETQVVVSMLCMCTIRRLETLDFDRPESKIWTLDSKTEIIHTFCSSREYNFFFIHISIVSIVAVYIVVERCIWHVWPCSPHFVSAGAAAAADAYFSLSIVMLW